MASRPSTSIGLNDWYAVSAQGVGEGRGRNATQQVVQSFCDDVMTDKLC